jgi:hypothetical protein
MSILANTNKCKTSELYALDKLYITAYQERYLMEQLPDEQKTPEDSRPAFLTKMQTDILDFDVSVLVKELKEKYPHYSREQIKLFITYRLLGKVMDVCSDEYM